MKKLLLVFLLMAAGAVSLSAGECKIGFLPNAPEGLSSKKVDGAAFGLPVVKTAGIDGAEISLIGSITKELKGCQLTLLGFNKAEKITGVQLSFANFILNDYEKWDLQVGAYNQAKEGFIQVGIVNNARTSTSVQVGLICINSRGFLPIFPFFNIDKKLF